MTSVTLTGGDKLDRKLAEIAMRVGRPFLLRVGFLENATYPDGTPVAMIAALLNFGISNGKSWPFFSQVIAEKSPQWGEQLAGILQANDWDLEKSLAMMGEGIAGQIRQAIVDTDSPELELSTVHAKGFDKPLVDSGHMLNSVDYEVAGVGG